RRISRLPRLHDECLRRLNLAGRVLPRLSLPAVDRLQRRAYRERPCAHQSRGESARPRDTVRLGVRFKLAPASATDSRRRRPATSVAQELSEAVMTGEG